MCCLTHLYHVVQDTFHGHGMGANAAGSKEVAIATPITFLIGNDVGIVVSINVNPHRIKLNAIGSFLSIDFCLLDFANHPIIHNFYAPLCKIGL
jgi:hypothetical protein